SNISAQWDLSLSMGFDFKSSPSFRDYINMSFASSGNQIASFKSAISFSGEADYKIAESFALGLEYNLSLDSYNTPFGIGGIYEISYNMHRPSILAYYIIPGEGYQFKLGGGAGPRFISLSERIIDTENYNSSGVGFVLKAEGNTMFSKDFYALIGLNFRYDLSGEFSNPNTSLINKTINEKMNLNSISFGIYLGVTFIL
ncbi:MAG: hypothetical protein AB1298_03200, partial [Bacteroidota bacterium]